MSAPPLPHSPGLPLGTPDLDPVPVVLPGRPRRLRCFVRGCPVVLRPPTRSDLGDVCPAHGIRCHGSGRSATYSYADPVRNVVVAHDLFRSRVVGSPHKYESHRLGHEKSEDALTWNVFRTLQEAGRLHRVARLATGIDLPAEPLLFLWGLCLAGDALTPWDLLGDARARFESHLPVNRPHTEPDIALLLPGHYLVLIEAKFTSPNTAYEAGPRRDRSSLTLDELLDLYHDGEASPLDRDAARAAGRVHYQLWRNLTFAGWMAPRAGPGTRAHLASLTRAGAEGESCAEFARLVRPGRREAFAHLSWEQVVDGAGADQPRLELLRHYLATKTAGLRPAFRQGTAG